jgi:hypothetical protein
MAKFLRKDSLTAHEVTRVKKGICPTMRNMSSLGGRKV